ncbi:Transcriptional regulator PadR-like family protein [compost metagenome]
MTLQIFILGTLSEGDHHPYDIKKNIFKPLENSIPINDGTLYYNFEVLAKKGLIQKIKVVQTGNRPEKTTYGITEKGRLALEEEIYSVFQHFTSVSSLYSSLLFLDKVDSKKLAYIIEEAIAKLNAKIRMIDGVDPALLPIPEAKRIAVNMITERAYENLKKDADWLSRLLTHVRTL